MFGGKLLRYTGIVWHKSYIYTYIHWEMVSKSLYFHPYLGKIPILTKKNDSDDFAKKDTCNPFVLYFGGETPSKTRSFPIKNNGHLGFQVNMRNFLGNVGC